MIWWWHRLRIARPEPVGCTPWRRKRPRAPERRPLLHPPRPWAAQRERFNLHRPVILHVTVKQRFAAGTLNAYACQQQLSHYWVYQTRRDGNPWYVLINRVYPSLSQAKNAVAQLPADVQAKKSWARQIGQVKKDQNNKLS